MSEDKERAQVDAATEIAILKMGQSFVDNVKLIITEEITNLEERQNKHNDLRFDHIEKDQERSFKYHEKHYESIGLMEKKLSSVELEILKKVDEKLLPVQEHIGQVDKRQSADEISEVTKEKMAGNAATKSEMTWNKIGGLIAIASVVFGTIGFLVKDIIGILTK